MIIEDERHYENTKVAIAQLEGDLAAPERPSPDIEPAMHELVRDGIKDRLEDLRDQVDDYERRRSGRYQTLERSALASLPIVLICARLGAGLTEKALAERLGWDEETLRRCEATRYAEATFAQVQAVAAALDIKVQQHLSLPWSVTSDWGELPPSLLADVEAPPVAKTRRSA